MKGQTMAEFALVASALFLLTFGIVQMGLAIYRYSNVCSAAREAVRYAIVHGPTSTNPASNSSVQQVAINYAPFLSASDVTVSWPADPQLASQQDAEVQIIHIYHLPIPFMSAVNLSLSSTSRMLVSK